MNFRSELDDEIVCVAVSQSNSELQIYIPSAFKFTDENYKIGNVNCSMSLMEINFNILTNFGIKNTYSQNKSDIFQTNHGNFRS